MTDKPLREADGIRRDCAQKLRSVETIGMLSSLLGYLVDEDWATPKIEELQMLPDRLLIRIEGDDALKPVIGVREDFVRLVHELGETAKLDEVELGYLLGRVAEIRSVTS
jgi:hypothetical protein